MLSIAYITLLVACGGDDVEPSPWEGIGATALSSLHIPATTPIEGAVAPRELLVVDGVTAVLDTSAGRVHLLDDRLGHTSDAFCLYDERFERFEVGVDQQGDCGAGEVELRRGVLVSSGLPVAFASAGGAGSGIWVLDHFGEVYFTDTDILLENPFDYLRQFPVFGSGIDGATSIAATESIVWIGSGSSLYSFGLSGEVVDVMEMSGVIENLVVSAGELWVAMDSALYSESHGEFLLPSALVESDGQGGVWAVDTGAASLVHLPIGAEIQLSRPPVAIAAESTESVWVADSSSVYRVIEGEIGEGSSVAGVIDIFAPNVDELLILDSSGVSVGFDQAAMATGVALDFVFVTYAEKPRSAADGIPCNREAEGDHEAFITVEELVANGSRNRGWLNDIPSPAAIGVTPHLARRVRDCELEEEFEPVWSANNTELGALFHELPDESCAADDACYVDFLKSEVGPLRQLGLSVDWASGLTTHGDLGVDWVQALSAAEVSNTYVGFGLSALEEIRHEDDPRSKEPFSLAVARESVPWSASSLESIDVHDPDGSVLFLPGDNRAAFNLGVCENLFIWECYILGLGGQHRFDQEDMDALDLLLHRAIARRDRSDTSTWHLHLPDIGSWDYTEGCEVTSREWRGDCGAALFQEWLIELHTTLALNGVVNWSSPSRVWVE